MENSIYRTFYAYRRQFVLGCILFSSILCGFAGFVSKTDILPVYIKVIGGAFLGGISGGLLFYICVMGLLGNYYQARKSMKRYIYFYAYVYQRQITVSFVIIFALLGSTWGINGFISGGLVGLIFCILIYRLLDKYL